MTRTWFWTSLLFLLATGGGYGQALAAQAPVPAPIQAQAQLIIIIDDIGNNLALGEAAVDLPGDITLSVLPNTPHGKELAAIAKFYGKCVMLHQPMETVSGMNSGAGALLQSMDYNDFINTLKNNIAFIPQATGMNNHMGSLLTQLPTPMDWVMKELQDNKLFFIDSRTDANSIAQQRAEKHGLPTLKRDVFLDNDRALPALKKQFYRAIDIAKQSGHAVMIGHPYPETLAFLKERLPTVATQYGVQLVKADDFFYAPAKRTIIAASPSIMNDTDDINIDNLNVNESALTPIIPSSINIDSPIKESFDADNASMKDMLPTPKNPPSRYQLQLQGV
ncbi:MAG: divergent polysaccharide deacetylase family protein [Oleibacter sp.]|nr:divergent polysaccharide deacetylase family protein [Thalassolituus sp.]